MMFRATVCCAALILGLLAALSVTAQSAGACNGGTCSSAQPLNLMNFMNGSGKAGSAKGATAAPTATATKTAARHRRVKTATRAQGDGLAPSPEPPALPAAAATAYAADAAASPSDVQVVSGDVINAIDLAMGKADRPAAETNGASPGAGDDNRDRVKWAASELQPEQPKPINTPADDATNNTTIRDDSWMGRFWSMIGDGYVALMAMIKQLFS